MKLIKYNSSEITEALSANFPNEWRKNWSKDHLHTLLIVEKENKFLGRIAVYLNDHYKNIGVAFLGAYECIEDRTVTHLLLSKAIKILDELNIKKVFGPIDGSTWNNYRFKENNNQHFFMEPNQPNWYPKQWEDFGFKNFQSYQSRILDLPTFKTDHVQGLREELEEKNITFRKLDLNDLDNELTVLIKFNENAFRNAVLYSPADKAAFIKNYKTILALADQDLILLAEYEKELVGFIFMLPDFNDPQKETCVLKTLAKKKGKRFNKLGWFLSHNAQLIAKNKGYKKVIHALMVDGNPSIRLSMLEKSKLHGTYKLYSYEIS